MRWVSKVSVATWAAARRTRRRRRHADDGRRQEVARRVDERGARGERHRRVGHGLEHVVLDVDQGGRLACGVPARGGDRCQCIPDVPCRLSLGDQDRPVARSAGPGRGRPGRRARSRPRGPPGGRRLVTSRSGGRRLVDDRRSGPRRGPSRARSCPPRRRARRGRGRRPRSARPARRRRRSRPARSRTPRLAAAPPRPTRWHR